MTGVNSRISEYHPETLGIYEKMPGTEEMGFMTPAFKNGIETTGKNITILYKIANSGPQIRAPDKKYSSFSLT